MEFRKPDREEGPQEGKTNFRKKRDSEKIAAKSPPITVSAPGTTEGPGIENF
jgi:hypothetical protein